MDPMADFEHLVKSYDVSDLLDEIASADPPAYLRRCFAEAAPHPACPGPGAATRRLRDGTRRHRQ